MREIKFRAWDEVNKRIVEVKEIRFRDSRSTPYELRDESGDVVGQWLIDKPDLMQYTGLKDKNGKEIYEGDIVCNRYSGGAKKGQVYDKAEVKWGVFNIGVNYNEYDFYVAGPYVEEEYLYGEMVSGQVEVIGNIYENPELLEK